MSSLPSVAAAQRQRSTFLDYLKGILIVLVLIGHTNQFFVYRTDGFWVDPLFKAIYTFHMPLFMAVAGYLSYSSVARDGLATIFIAKLRAYILPIFVWACIAAVVMAIWSQNMSVVTFLGGLALGFVRSLWFLWAAFISLIITSLVFKIGRNFLLLSLLALAIVIIAVPNKGMLPLFKYTFPFFQIGFLIAMRRPVFRMPPIVWLLLALCAFACFWFWNTDTYIYTTGMALSEANLKNIALRYVAGLICSLAALGLIKLLHDKLFAWGGRLICELGKNSIYIYILQEYVVAGLQWLSLKFFPEITSYLVGWVASVAIGIALTVFCWAVGLFLARSKFSAFLLFGKSIRA